MAEDRIWSAAELELLTPDERHRVFNEGVVTDLDQLSPEFLARVRAKGRALLAGAGPRHTADRWRLIEESSGSHLPSSTSLTTNAAPIVATRTNRP